MSSIKVNVRNRYTGKYTSTTFTEVTARFFCKSWNNFVDLDPNSNEWNQSYTRFATNPSNDPLNKNPMVRYVDIDELKTDFQKAITQMINYFDSVYAGKTLKAWSKKEVEYHIFLVIERVNQGLKCDFEHFLKFNKNESND